jgi:hypothetical protein
MHGSPASRRWPSGREQITAVGRSPQTLEVPERIGRHNRELGATAPSEIRCPQCVAMAERLLAGR